MLPSALSSLRLGWFFKAQYTLTVVEGDGGHQEAPGSGKLGEVAGGLARAHLQNTSARRGSAVRDMLSLAMRAADASSSKTWPGRPARCDPESCQRARVALEATGTLASGKQASKHKLLTPPARKKKRSDRVRKTALVAMVSLKVQSHSRKVCSGGVRKGCTTRVGLQGGAVFGAAQHAQHGLPPP